MFNGRLYRAAFLPFLLALAVAALSLGGRPLPLTSNFAPDAFEGQRALAALNGLAGAFPQRRPGSAGDQRLAEHVATTLRALGGFSVHIRRSNSQTIDGERSLTTVIAERPGSTSAAPILLLAHRDAAVAGSKAELSGTAALLELARVLAARETKRTIILASTSGGSGGDGGAAQLTANLTELGQHGPFDAAIVLGDVAGKRAQRPFVVPLLRRLRLRAASTAAHALRRDRARGRHQPRRAQPARPAGAPGLPAGHRRAGRARRSGRPGGARAGIERTRARARRSGRGGSPGRHRPRCAERDRRARHGPPTSLRPNRRESSSSTS